MELADLVFVTSNLGKLREAEDEPPSPGPAVGPKDGPRGPGAATMVAAALGDQRLPPALREKGPPPR